MILPDKHISLAESLLGLGTFVLDSVISPKNIDSLWFEFEKIRGNEYPAHHSFDNLVLTVNMLYALKMIKMTDGDLLQRVSYHASN
jgi:hypothetical protein